MDLNAVPLQIAVLCVDCESVSDSPHDQCRVCGSHSLFNLSRVLGGTLPGQRASIVAGEMLEAGRSQVLVTFSSAPARVRRKSIR